MAKAENTGIAAPARALYTNSYLLALTLLIIFMAGYSALSNLPRIEDPRITPRYPQITTLMPGASAARIEALVTDPIEDALREIDELKKVESRSVAGISILNLELAEHIGPGENERVFSKIQNQLKNVSASLPATASQPFFNDKFSAVAFSKVIAISWSTDEPPPLGVMSRLAEDLADRMRELSGTELVRVYGAPEEEVEVSINGAELRALGLGSAELSALIGAADSRLPAGAMRSNDTTLLLDMDGDIDSLERIRRIPVAENAGGALVTVGEIASVRKRWLDPPRDMTMTNGNRSVLVAVRTATDIRLDEWAVQSSRVIDTFRDERGGGFQVDVVFDQSIYTEQRLNSLGGNLLAGAILVMIVVFVGMGWRAALIVGAALPVSASIALFGLSVFGQQLHQMAIFGMIIAIGLLIDNAIVITDEIKKNLDAGSPRPQAMQNALSHLFVPLLASTLTTILGFMPVFLLPGAMGDFVGPIAIAVVLSLTASFAAATSLIPALAGRFLLRKEQHSSNPWWVGGYRSKKMTERYRRLLGIAFERPLVTVLACMVLPVIGFLLAGTLGEQFFPAADRNQFEVEVRLAPQTSIEETKRRATQIEESLREFPEVSEVHWRISGSYPTLYYNRIMRERNNDAYAHAMVFTETIGQASKLTRILPDFMAERFPDAQIIVAPFAQGPPVSAPVAFELQGQDPAVLRELGRELRRIMHEVPGIVHTRATVSGGLPKLEFHPDEFATNAVGLSLSALAGQMYAELEGRSGGVLLEDLEELPVRVRLRESERNSVAALSDLLIRSPGTREWFPVSTLGSLELRPEASIISRRDSVRSNRVYGYLERDVLPIDVSNAVLAQMESSGFTLPPGYVINVQGDSAEQADAFGSLFTYLPILLMLMIATIVLSFRSLRLAALIVTVAVLSVGLGMLSLWFGGYARGFNAVIGSVGLIGVAINGTIVVLAAIRANPNSCDGNLEAMISETVGATRHIVSTTLTTVGGFVPLLFFSGGDFWPPLAIVIAGGVGFSISLSLLFTPAAYRLLCGRRRHDVQAPALAGARA